MSFKNKNIVREFPFFSHFMCLPLIQQSIKQLIQRAQQAVEQKLTGLGIRVEEALKRSSTMLGHLTLFMLTLRREQVKQKLSQLLKQQQPQITHLLSPLQLQFTSIKYFTRLNKNQKLNQLTVIYLQIDQQSQRLLQQFIDYFTKILLKNEIIVSEQLKPMRIGYNHKLGVFQLQTFHVTLFRCRGVMERADVMEVFGEINRNMQKSKIEQLEQKWSQLQSTQRKSNNLKELTTINHKCPALDVSTMMAFDETQFYLPFIRVLINKPQQ